MINQLDKLIQINSTGKFFGKSKKKMSK